jgi:hypothetical protein
MYKLRHKPTGLFYRPFKDGTSLSEKGGKIYETPINILSIGYYSNGDPRKILTVRAHKRTGIYKKFKDSFEWKECSYYLGEFNADTKAEEWEKN